MFLLNSVLEDKGNVDMNTHKENNSQEWEWLLYISFGKIKLKCIFFIN